MLTSCNHVPEKKQPTQLIEASTSFYDAQINDFIGETTTSEKSSEEIVPENGEYFDWSLTVTDEMIHIYCNHFPSQRNSIQE